MTKSTAPKDAGWPAPPLRWSSDAGGRLEILDQTLLPAHETWISCRSAREVYDAIRRLAVRGAPAIGIAAAFGACLGVIERRPATFDAFLQALKEATALIASARPTAKNLSWALERIWEAALAARGSAARDAEAAILAEAKAIHKEDLAAGRALSKAGVGLVPNGGNVLTICNTGALATGGEGTALGVCFAAKAAGKRFRVFACETRPLLQGSRLTMWECAKAGLDAILLADSAAGSLLRTGRIGLVITGADRIAANGDAANKVGTYSLSVLAKTHDVPFWIAAPLSTFDPSTREGRGIPIEERNPREVLEFHGVRTAPAGASAWNPAFDVTPAENISGFVTEKGLLQPPFPASIAKALGRAPSPPKTKSRRRT
ncbi:MAG: S-methyl-5-thioribose-1-phosphate isomerase [Planctomycetota bacterium]